MREFSYKSFVLKRYLLSDGLTRYLRKPNARNTKEFPTVTSKKKQNIIKKPLDKRRENRKERKNKQINKTAIN